jgi:hypothetical protein
MLRLGVVCFSLFLSLSGYSAYAQVLKVQANGRTFEVTLTEILSLPHIVVTVSEQSQQTQFEGVPLSTILQRVGYDAGYGLHGPLLMQALLVEAADGEQVAFSLAEIDPTFVANNVILADKRNGKELSTREGPFRVIAPKDKRMDRWLPQVTTLRVGTVK